MSEYKTCKKADFIPSILSNILRNWLVAEVPLSLGNLSYGLCKGWPGRRTDDMIRRDLVILDELGDLPFARSGGQRRLRERPSIIVTPQPGLRRRAGRVQRSEDDDFKERSADPPLRDRPDRPQVLALPELRLTSPHNMISSVGSGADLQPPDGINIAGRQGGVSSPFRLAPMRARVDAFADGRPGRRAGGSRWGIG